MSLLLSFVAGLSCGVSFLVARVFGGFRASGGVWYVSVKFIRQEGVRAGRVLHQGDVIAWAEILPEHCKGSVFYFLVDWDCINLVI